MEWISNLQGLLGLLTTIFTGGIIGSIVSIRYLKKSESAKAQQEVEKSEELGLKNTETLIGLYKDALTDVRTLHAQLESDYDNKVKDYEVQLKSLGEQLNRCKEVIISQEETINQLTKTQLKLKLQIQSLNSSLISNCSDCAFNNTCERLKARKLTYEQTNDSDIQCPAKSGGSCLRSDSK